MAAIARRQAAISTLMLTRIEGFISQPSGSRRAADPRVAE
jgi:hypothetical protein